MTASITPQDGHSNILGGVVALSPTDVWAAGDTFAGSGEPRQAYGFVEHWDGTAWSLVPSPRFHVGSGLEDISATSDSDIWAVGSLQEAGGRANALIEHWDGTSWSRVTGHDGAANHGSLESADAITTADAWAVGGTMKYPHKSLLERWNGSTWTRVGNG